MTGMGIENTTNQETADLPDLVADASVEERIAKELGSFGNESDLYPEEQLPDPVVSGISLYPGVELGIEDMAALMREEPSQLIAILGPQNAGKTLYLVALYLICACGRAADFGYEFAGSLTLPGFEDRARNSRRWRIGEIPAKMSVHTRVGDNRGPGFMHLDLLHNETSSIKRLFLSDLPGEWTTQLIDAAHLSERFSFLGRADVICLMIEATSLVGPLRHAEVERQRMLIDRIKGIVAPDGRKMAIIATKGDVIKLRQPQALQEIADYASDAGFQTTAMTVASVSSDDEIESGAGIFESLIWMLGATGLARVTSALPARVPERLFGWTPIMAGSPSLD